LEKVLKFLGDNAGANIVVNWKGLKMFAEVEPTTPVTVSLKKVPLKKALQTVLDLAAGGSGIVGFDFEDGVITVSMAQDLEAKRKAREGAAGGVPQRRLVVDPALVPQIAMPQAPAGSHDALIDLLDKRNALEGDKRGASEKYGAQSQLVKDIEARLADTERQIKEMSDRMARTEAEAKKRAEALVTMTYDAWPICGLPPTKANGVAGVVLDANQRAVVDELVKTLQPVLKADETVSAVNGTIVVKADKEGQEKVRAVMQLLLFEQEKRTGEQAPTAGIK
jgi:hypothetical protein